MLVLASKKEILEKVKEKHHAWFSEKLYITGVHEGGPYKNQETGQVADTYDDLIALNLEYKEENKFELVPSPDDILFDSVKTIEDRNEGDGNECFFTLHFEQYNLYVSLIGTYSSWNDPYWVEVFISTPYVYQETRFKAVS